MGCLYSSVGYAGECYMHRLPPELVLIIASKSSRVDARALSQCTSEYRRIIELGTFPLRPDKCLQITCINNIYRQMTASIAKKIGVNPMIEYCYCIKLNLHTISNDIECEFEKCTRYRTEQFSASTRSINAKNMYFVECMRTISWYDIYPEERARHMVRLADPPLFGNRCHIEDDDSISIIIDN
jgi:hypothetical protein